MFCGVVAPANHSRPRNWGTRLHGSLPLAPRAVLIIKVTARVLSWDHRANFPRSLHFLSFIFFFFFLFAFVFLGVPEWWLSAPVLQSSSAWVRVTAVSSQAPRDPCTWHHLLDALQYYFHLPWKDTSFKPCKLVSSSEPISSELRATPAGSVVSAGLADTAPNHLAWVLGYDQSSWNPW